MAEMMQPSGVLINPLWIWVISGGWMFFPGEYVVQLIIAIRYV